MVVRWNFGVSGMWEVSAAPRSLKSFLLIKLGPLARVGCGGVGGREELSSHVAGELISPSNAGLWRVLGGAWFPGSPQSFVEISSSCSVSSFVSTPATFALLIWSTEYTIERVSEGGIETREVNEGWTNISNEKKNLRTVCVSERKNSWTLSIERQYIF